MKGVCLFLKKCLLHCNVDGDLVEHGCGVCAREGGRGVGGASNQGSPNLLQRLVFVVLVVLQ